MAGSTLLAIAIQPIAFIVAIIIYYLKTKEKQH